MLMETDPEAKLILGDVIILLHALIVDGIPDFAMHEINGFR